MRFSSIFQHASPLHTPAQAQHAMREKVPAEFQASEAAPLADLPDDLDQRVRLIGEWQLGADA